MADRNYMNIIQNVHFNCILWKTLPALKNILYKHKLVLIPFSEYSHTF